MGSSADAHIAYGWAMPEDKCSWMPGHENCKHVVRYEDDGTTVDYEYWDCEAEDEDSDDLYELLDDSEFLEQGFAGSFVYGDMETVIFVKGTDTDTSWAAKALQPGDLTVTPEQVQAAKDEAEKLGITLTGVPSWVLWPSHG